MESSLTIKESFTLHTDLIKRLRAAARKMGWSYNDYVESVLSDAVYNKPNAETKAAIEEAVRGNDLNPVDTSSYEAFCKSLE